MVSELLLTLGLDSIWPLQSDFRWSPGTAVLTSSGSSSDGVWGGGVARHMTNTDLKVNLNCPTRGDVDLMPEDGATRVSVASVGS